MITHSGLVPATQSGGPHSHVSDVENGVMRKEYIPRLQSAARDGKQRGIPGTYFAKYWGPFMPIHYFAYGINMSIEEMRAKSPKAEFLKIVKLEKWCTPQIVFAQLQVDHDHL